MTTNEPEPCPYFRLPISLSAVVEEVRLKVRIAFLILGDSSLNFRLRLFLVFTFASVATSARDLVFACGCGLAVLCNPRNFTPENFGAVDLKFGFAVQRLSGHKFVGYFLACG